MFTYWAGHTAFRDLGGGWMGGRGVGGTILLSITKSAFIFTKLKALVTSIKTTYRGFFCFRYKTCWGWQELQPCLSDWGGKCHGRPCLYVEFYVTLIRIPFGDDGVSCGTVPISFLHLMASEAVYFHTSLARPAIIFSLQFLHWSNWSSSAPMLKSVCSLHVKVMLMTDVFHKYRSRYHSAHF